MERKLPVRVLENDIQPEDTIMLVDSVEIAKFTENWLSRMRGEPERHVVDFSKATVLKIGKHPAPPTE